MSLLLQAISVPTLIIKPWLILVTHMDDLGWYISSNQQGQMFVQNLNRIVSKPNVTPWQIPYCTTDSILIDLMFQENLPTHTQVWNRLSHWIINTVYFRNIQLQRACKKNDLTAIHVIPCAWVGRQPTDRYRRQCDVKGCNSMTVLGRINKPLLMVAIQITHKHERGMEILSLHGSHWW